jgi:orotidine-5'-phosphate decarboxylase
MLYFFQRFQVSLAAIRRVKFIDMVEGRGPTDGTPWVADVRSYDIPETIVACIWSVARGGGVAITLSPKGGARMIKLAEHAARKANIRILWWTF